MRGCGSFWVTTCRVLRASLLRLRSSTNGRKRVKEKLWRAMPVNGAECGVHKPLTKKACETAYIAQSRTCVSDRTGFWYGYKTLKNMETFSCNNKRNKVGSASKHLTVSWVDADTEEENVKFLHKKEEENGAGRKWQDRVTKKVHCKNKIKCPQ